MTYFILTASDPDELTKEVMDHIKVGWKPQGGVSVALSNYHSTDHRGDTQNNRETIFAQAMILES